MNKEQSKTSAIFSARVEVMDLATISYAFDLLKVEYTSKSNLISIVAHQYAEMLKRVFADTKKGDVEFSSLQQAIDYLTLHKRLDIKKIKVGKEQFQENMKDAVLASLDTEGISTRSKELIETVEPTETLNDKGIPDHLQGGKGL